MPKKGLEKLSYFLFQHHATLSRGDGVVVVTLA